MPPMVMATSLPITWADTMVMASHWVGFTLPGMMEEPGSFSGMYSSPMPARGPEASIRMSLAIFIRLSGHRFQGAVGFHDGIVGSQGFKFVFGRDEGQAGEFGNVLGYVLGVVGGRVDARTYGRAAQGQFRSSAPACF